MTNETATQTNMPAGYCAKKAKLNLDAHQWADLESLDKAKYHFSSTKRQRAQRKLELHMTDCSSCASHYLGDKA